MQLRKEVLRARSFGLDTAEEGGEEAEEGGIARKEVLLRKEVLQLRKEVLRARSFGLDTALIEPW